jgi:hypothetical protein
MVRAIIFASALMIGGVALAQDAPPADAPPADAAAAAPADAPAADAAPATPAASDASYPACSAKVQDHCIQGAHKGGSHKPAKRTHHK